MDEKLRSLEDKLKYSFKDKSLLKQALSHSSYANERGLGALMSNERLEFLGDAVLELAVSENLFFTYPDMKEGELTKLRAKLVCEPSLAAFSERIELRDYILLGHGEEKTGGRSRKSIISDCMEALIGAIYIDAGMDEAKAFITANILFDVENVTYFSDNKTRLQEIIQAEGKSLVYTLVNEEGPPHSKVFTMEVTIDGRMLGRGSAGTKKEAEQAAAKEALSRLKEKD